MKVLCSNPARVKMEVGDPEVVEIRVLDKRFLYDPNSMFLGELLPGEDIAKAIQTCQDPRLGFPGRPIFPDVKLPHFRSIVVEHTYACNLRCDYCFVWQHYEKAGKGDLAPEIAAEFIERYLDPDPKVQTNLGFFGGEPLIKWDSMVKIALAYEDWCKRHEKKGSLHVTTNGVLIDDEKAAFLKEHNFSFIVSLDGPEELHDLHRKTADGKGSFKQVLAGLERMAKHGLTQRCTLRSTYTCEAPYLVERLEFLNGLCDRGLGSHVSVEPAFATESKCSKLDEGAEKLTQYQIETLEKEYEKAARWYAGRLINGQNARYHHFMMPIQRILYAQHSPSECGAGKGYASLSWDGTICACHRESHTAIGSMKDGIDPAKQNPWLDNRYTTSKTCSVCPLRNVCGGLCRETSILYGRDMHDPLPTACAFTRMRIKYAMWLISTLGPKILATKIPNPAFRQIRLPKGMCS